jgi:nucleotide-binding universal stress UspA family protein
MRKILVPTDFSENALKAASYAAEIASKNGACIYLLHAAEMGHEKFYQPVSMYEKYNNLVLDEDKDRLENLRSLLQSNFPACIVETHIEAESGIAESIHRFCRSQEIDIIIMGTHGASGLKSVLLGSVAASVISGSKIPVLAIPAEYTPQPPQAILLATNQFEEDSEMLGRLMDLVKIFPALLHVVVFVDKEHDDAADYITQTTRLHRYVEFLEESFPDVNLKPSVLEGEDIEDALELYRLRNDIDMIALISYPKSFFEKIFQKSTSRKLAFHSKIPVLAIPAIKAHAQ